MRLERCIHTSVIETQMQRVVAFAVGAVCLEIRAGVLERAQPRSAPHPQRRGRTRERRTESERVDRKPRHLDVRHRHAARAAPRRRQPLHIEPRRLEFIDLHAPCEQRQRRPIDRDPLGAQPNALLVDELQPRERQMSGE